MGVPVEAVGVVPVRRVHADVRGVALAQPGPVLAGEHLEVQRIPPAGFYHVHHFGAGDDGAIM